MADELGRGLLSSWPDARWKELDKLATDTVASLAKFRQVFATGQEDGAFNVRIGRQNVERRIFSADFKIDLVADSSDDIDRKVLQAAKKVALKEDERVANTIPRTRRQQYQKDLDTFSSAREQLVKEGVDSGYVIVVSPSVQVDLETTMIPIGGGVTLRSAVESLLGTTVLVSSALGAILFKEHTADRIDSIRESLEEFAADAKIAEAIKALSEKLRKDKNLVGVLAEAEPQIGQIVQTFPPRLRVLELDSTSASMRVEEGVAVAAFDDALAVVLHK